ncbi:MAG: NYN domain-containing protein [Patescibacteria group bacterium]|jgi:uncharacterized LabA/DUF88 family protein
MRLEEVELNNLGISKKKYGRICSFVDFGNVDYWYEKDERDWEGNLLRPDEKLVIDLCKLANFAHLFSEKARYYFGFDPANSKSVAFMDKSREYFDNTITKPIQQIRHHLSDEEAKNNTRRVRSDGVGPYIYIPKCNFDVEICVDAIRLLNEYDTFCLFSSDADFIRLIHYLKKKNKEIILIKSGHIQHELRDAVGPTGLVIGAQNIKAQITLKKQKSRL